MSIVVDLRAYRGSTALTLRGVPGASLVPDHPRPYVTTTLTDQPLDHPYHHPLTSCRAVTKMLSICSEVCVPCDT